MQMTLKRKSDNYLLTNRIYGWGGWGEDPAPRRDTISGMPVSIVGQKARPRFAAINATFSADDPDSSLSDLQEIFRLHHRYQTLVFTDREGGQTDVRVLEWEQEAWDDVKTKTVVNVSFLLCDVAVRY